MKKLTLLILVVALLTAMGISCFASAPDSSYELVFSDEFDGTELNTDVWKYRTGDAYGGKNLKENVRITDGKLYLDYTKTDGIYSGAGIITDFNLPYGYYETKAKIFTGVNGLHTSFWTAGGILEIDAFEADSNQGSSAPIPQYNLHYWWADHSMVGGTNFDNNTDGNTSTSDWFISGFEWLPGKIIFYSNGKVVGTVSPDVFSPSDLWLTAVATPDWHINENGTYNIDDSKMDANGYFGSSEYEYFRYYSKKLKGVNLLGNGHFELNRTKTNTTISSFDVIKNAVPVKSPFAHKGYCFALLSDTAELGQTLKYLPAGNYTFEGYFKTKTDTSATLSVYDKDNNLLKSVSVPQCNDWTLVSLKDIAVADSAYVVVKSTAGSLMADDLAFYCQEGDTTYEGYEESNYKKYNALPENTEQPVLNSALIAQLDSPVYQYNNNPYTFSATDTSLVPCKKNGEICVPYQAIKSAFPISGVASNSTYVTLSQINASGTYVAYTYADCILLCNASATVTTDTKLAAKLSLHNFIDPFSRIESTAIYAETADVENQTVYDIDTATLSGTWGNSSIGYASKGKYATAPQSYVVWTPTFKVPNNYTVQIYSAPHAGSSGVSPTTDDAGVDLTIGNKTYSYSLNQYNGTAGWYNLGSFKTLPNDVMHIKLYNAKGTGLLRASAIRIIPNDTFDQATYAGTADLPNQTVYDINDCNLQGAWETSGMGYGGSSRYVRNSAATANWTVVPPSAGDYSIQIYSIAHAGNTATNAPPSTTAAGVYLEVNGERHYYRLNQCTGNSGWYDLGKFTLELGQSADITLHHTLADGHLRANAVRIVPENLTEAIYVGNTDAPTQIVYDINDCTLESKWGTSSMGYTGGSRYSGEPDASATWTVTASDKGKYSVQIYSIAHAGDASINAPASTTAAGVRLEIAGTAYRYTLNQCTGSTGWYDLGTFELDANQTASIKLYHTLGDGHLRANAVRLVPETAPITTYFLGKSTEANQELHPFSEATTTGTWAASGGALTGCYYGNGTAATVSWSVTPNHSKKYSVQIYIPCMDNGNTTQEAVVTLDVNRTTYTYNMNQRQDTTNYTGWYDLGLFDLNNSEAVSVSLSMKSGQFLRAKDFRLVPVPDSIPATNSSGTVSLSPGFMKNYIGKVLFAEYNGTTLHKVQSLDPSASMTFTMDNASNAFKIFFWQDTSSFSPIINKTEN